MSNCKTTSRWQQTQHLQTQACWQNKLDWTWRETTTTYNKWIWLPQDVGNHLIQWYHISLMHVGMTWMLNMIGNYIGYPGIHCDCEELVKKLTSVNATRLPESRTMVRFLYLLPFRTRSSGKSFISTAWGLGQPTSKMKSSERSCNSSLIFLQSRTAITANKTAWHMAKLFDKIWLCRYPWPEKVIAYTGSKVVRAQFWETLESYSIKLHPTMVKNPQANAVIEHLHGPLGDQLCWITFWGDNFLEDIDAIVQACAYATGSI